MGLVEKVADAHRGRSRGARKAAPLEDVSLPFWGSGSGLFGDREQIENDFRSYIYDIYKANGPVSSLLNVRLLVFSEARLQFRRMRNGRPGDLFGTAALAPLEAPWPGATTRTMLSRMIQDADLAGNAFLANYRGAIRRMRPDRTTIVLGSRSQPDLQITPGTLPLDTELVGYLYSPTWRTDLRGTGPLDVFLLPHEVAHFAPIPDPDATYRGMSWLTPVIEEIRSDKAATRHKAAFFRNSATPRLAVRLDASVSPDLLKRFRAVMEESHAGIDKAYSTLYLGGGADVTPLTMSMRELDYKAVQALGETRLASAAGVPPVIVGFSEGLAGSSLNAGNYGAAKRRFVDATMRPLWGNAAGALSTLVEVPSGAELWWDDRDIAFLREDAADRANIQQIKGSTIRQLIDAGFKADSIVRAIEAEDYSLLEHSGLFSVQLQPPSTVTAPALPAAPPTDPTGQSDPAREQ